MFLETDTRNAGEIAGASQRAELGTTDARNRRETIEASVSTAPKLALTSDARNAQEVAEASQSTAPKLALFFYRDRIAEGYPHGCAYVMALSYLRRKTGLSIPLAMAALDQLLEVTL